MTNMRYAGDDDILVDTLVISAFNPMGKGCSVLNLLSSHISLQNDFFQNYWDLSKTISLFSPKLSWLVKNDFFLFLFFFFWKRWVWCSTKAETKAKAWFLLEKMISLSASRTKTLRSCISSIKLVLLLMTMTD